MHWLVQGVDSANHVQNQTTHPYMVTRQRKTGHVNIVIEQLRLFLRFAKNIKIHKKFPASCRFAVTMKKLQSSRLHINKFVATWTSLQLSTGTSVRWSRQHEWCLRRRADKSTHTAHLAICTHYYFCA